MEKKQKNNPNNNNRTENLLCGIWVNVRTNRLLIDSECICSLPKNAGRRNREMEILPPDVGDMSFLYVNLGYDSVAANITIWPGNNFYSERLQTG